MNGGRVYSDYKISTDVFQEGGIMPNHIKKILEQFCDLMKEYDFPAIDQKKLRHLIGESVAHVQAQLYLTSAGLLYVH
ncbi:MAG: hypothetical protein N3D11_01510, partial [Candidatus Sumerlaeia bacterium]|nr:hypothetical protein [Candidatus Sumerlaeia bacterium]